MIEISLTIKGQGEPKTYILAQTSEAVKNAKTGKTSLAHFQPASDNIVVMPFSKLYINTEALAETPKAKAKK